MWMHLLKATSKFFLAVQQVDEIVLLGGDNRATSEITKLISQLPPAVQAITGVDLTGVLTKIPGASAPAQ